MTLGLHGGKAVALGDKGKVVSLVGQLFQPRGKVRPGAPDFGFGLLSGARVPNALIAARAVTAMVRA
jgi:hypothetical protein